VLATLSKDSQQIRGALKMLGQDDAERLLGLCQEQIDSYGDPEAAVDGEDLELLAESLSGLGFYIEAMEQQRAGSAAADRALRQAPGEPVERVDRHAESVEHAVEEAMRCPRSSPKSIARPPTRPLANS
jgi:chemosensory pili system protein ChpA (sensor histidine kinase/response regulator)